jgi:hypothetical protein
MSVYSHFISFMYPYVVQYRNQTNENSEFLKFSEDIQSMYLYNISCNSYFHFQCQTEVYRKEDGEFKKTVLVAGPLPCCDLYKYGLFKHMIETYNVPKACPFLPVSIYIYIYIYIYIQGC